MAGGEGGDDVGGPGKGKAQEIVNDVVAESGIDLEKEEAANRFIPTNTANVHHVCTDVPFLDYRYVDTPLTLHAKQMQF